MEKEMQEKMEVWAEMEQALEQSENERLKAQAGLNSFMSIYDQGHVKKDPNGQF